MACGVPVIGVRARALPEYINERNGIVVEPDDSEALAISIVDLLNHPERRQELGAGGVEFVQKFSPDRIADEWSSLYEKVLSNFNKK